MYTRTALVAVISLIVAVFPGATGARLQDSSSGNGLDTPQSPRGKLRRVADPVPGEYIVVLREDLSVSLAVSDELLARYGGARKFQYQNVLNGMSVAMPEVAAVALSEDPRVEFVEENGYMYAQDCQTSPVPPWGLDRIDDLDLPVDGSYCYGQDGTGVNAYLVDTGIRVTHQQFGGRASSVFDAIGDGQNGNDCYPPDGHGTLVASVIGGSRYGVAKNADLYGLRVFDCSGQGSPATNDRIVAALDWLVVNHQKPAVANLSIGGQASTAVDKAVRRTIAAGIVCVVAAGNSNKDAATQSPSRVASAIVVGGTMRNPQVDPTQDYRWPSSNFGNVVDLFAPGAEITGASTLSDTAITTKDGTSFAAPHVTGVVAQYLQGHPDACQCTVEQRLIGDATLNAILMGFTIPDTNPPTPNRMLFLPASWSASSYYSLSLNGSSAYIDVPNAGDTLGVSLDITGPITVEAWVRLDTNSIAQSIVARYSSTAPFGSADGGYELRLTSNGFLRFTNFRNSAEFDRVTGSTAVSSGVWHHVAGVFDGTQMRIYLDGALYASKSSTFAPGTGTKKLRIGSAPGNTDWFDGLVDEVRVTKGTVYTSTFVPAHKLTGTNGTRGLWRFDGQTAVDCASINNGTANGGAAFSTSVP
jgi:subtilisin family serine protease